jgi:hypothetical protein
MATREINGNTYSEFAVLAGEPLPTEPLGIPTVPRDLAAGATSASTALAATCRRVSIRARGADIRYVIGVGAQTANASSHFIGNGERLDWSVPEGAHIAVIRGGTVDGVLSVSEMV